MTVHSGVWRPEDRAAAKYAYLPVDVPPGAHGLTVTLGYDRTAGVLDLGLFDPAGAFDHYRQTLDTPRELWDKLIAVNLTSLYLVTKRVAR